MIHPTAVIDPGARIGPGTRIWHFCHVSPGAVIGAEAVLGQNVFVAPNVVVGDRCRIQNNVSIYEGVELEDDVFCGPSCVFTNVANPRAAIRRGQYARTLIRRGATIGANATIVCGGAIGRHAFVAAGAVVTRRDVPDYALVLGVPARQAGWIGRHGERLGSPDADGVRRCPASGWRYREDPAGVLRCLDRGEDEPL